jgi:hypothetical protein
MANDCENWVKFSHNDHAQMLGLKQAIDNCTPTKGLFSQYLPKPERYDYTWWTRRKWGTNRDVRIFKKVEINQDSIELTFDTAWEPPVAFYKYMVKQGFIIEALYFEPGMQFIGSFNNAQGDKAYNFDASNYHEIPEEYELRLGAISSIKEIFSEREND